LFALGHSTSPREAQASGLHGGTWTLGGGKRRANRSIERLKCGLRSDGTDIRGTRFAAADDLATFSEERHRRTAAAIDAQHDIVVNQTFGLETLCFQSGLYSPTALVKPGTRLLGRQPGQMRNKGRLQFAAAGIQKLIGFGLV
jgi:hypothetical protein